VATQLGGCAELGVGGDRSEGVERDGRGVPTGRLFDRDDSLAARLPRGWSPDLGVVSRRLASYGVTGVTDATPTRTAADLEALAAACRSGAVVQRVGAMGAAEARVPEGLDLGPAKVMVSDGRCPGVDGLAGQLEAVHRSGRWPCTA